MLRPALLACCASLLGACTPGTTTPASAAAHAPYTCVREADHRPAILPEADAFYRYAQHLRSRLPDEATDLSHAQFDEMAPFLRMASALGDHRASLALVDLMYEVRDQDYDNVATPWRSFREGEVNRLLDQMVADGAAAGLNRRAGFEKQNWNLPAALSLYRQAADLGHPDAQFRAAELLNPDTLIGSVAKASREDAAVAKALYRCAAGQGHHEAHSALARMLAGQFKRAEALQVFHQGAAAGDAESAAALMNHFEKHPPAGEAGGSNAERLRRYEAIRVFLITYQKEDVTVPDLERIVPFPPAELPAWDGQFQWLHARERQRATPPPKPSPALVERVSREKRLDPRTGLALPPA